jgi:mannosyl-oligosaccharide alpha-1,2-mannosidase
MYLADYDGANFRKNSGHLTCFHGGNFILGGQVLGRQDLIDFGLRLVEGCYRTYHSTTTKIGPEGYSWDENSVPARQRPFYNANGFYITNPGYNLRPEVIESYYYAYRATGNTTVRPTHPLLTG